MGIDESRIEFDGETFSVEAALIGNCLGIDPGQVQALMRERRITSRCERGVDQDAGRYRLTFFHERHRATLVVDSEGHLITLAATTDPQARLPRGAGR